MAKLYIPQVGNKIKLISNWNCKVFNEPRNSKVFKGLNIDVSNQKDANIDITFPNGTVLRMDRLYVRAPASSYDSITFTIESSPIKSLCKARFWVKLMDANNIEFEDIVSNIDSHLKLKDLYRFIALKNNYKNSEHLEQDDKNSVLKEIIEHFSLKGNKFVKFTFNISPEQFYQTLNFDDKHMYQVDAHNRYKSRIEQLKNKLNKIEVCFNYLPVLDGGIVTNFESNDSILLDKELDLFGKLKESYWNKIQLGSYLSRTNHFIYLDKKSLHPLLEDNLEDLSKIKIEYGGDIISIKSEKELQKFLKSIRV